MQTQMRTKGDVLARLLDGLGLALTADFPGREREWSETVEECLADIETSLRQIQDFAVRSDGPLAEVDETRPTLARQADKLRGSYDDHLKQIASLREELRHAAEAFHPATNLSATSAAGVPDFGSIRERTKRLLDALQECKEAETKLVLESMNTDIGVGD